MDLAERFEHNRSTTYKADGLIERLAMEGQHPETLILTCMDSRVSVHRLFGLDTGDALLLRSAGPIIPAYDADNSASQMLHENLSIAINDMRVPSITLLGHTKCGAAGKLATNLFGCGDIPVIKKNSSAILQTALNNVGDHDQDALIKEIEKQIIIQGVKNLFDYPAVIKGIKENRVTVEGLQFNIETGRLLKLKADGTAFRFDIVAGPKHGTLPCDCSHDQVRKAANA